MYEGPQLDSDEGRGEPTGGEWQWQWATGQRGPGGRIRRGVWSGLVWRRDVRNDMRQRRISELTSQSESASGMSIRYAMREATSK